MNNQQELWNQLSSSHKAFSLALGEFLSEGVNRVEIMKKEMMGQDRITAIYLLKYLSQEELTQLFNELVYLSSFSHGSMGIIRQVITSLPRNWVLENIQQVTAPILKNGGYDEYRRILELYRELDRNMTIHLARQAAEQQDPDIKEAGEDFLILTGE